MADQNVVESETKQEVESVQAAIIVGHNDKGEFRVVNATGNPYIALALLQHAVQATVAQINPDKPRKVVPFKGIIPGVRAH